MEISDARALIESLLESGGIRSVQWAIETRHPGAGGVASLTGDYPRVVLGLSGRRPLRITREGQPFRLLLKAGDCLVLAPHTWVILEPGSSYFSVGVALEARNPRLVFARHVHRARVLSNNPTPAEVRILPGLCDNITMALAAALLNAGDGRSTELYVRRLAEALWLRLVRERAPSDSPEAGKAFVTYSAAEHYVRDGFARAISREDVARFLRIHPSHVTRLFLQFAGETFGGFLLRVRLESARSLLRDPRLTVSEIAYLSGFASPNYFVRAYRERYRKTPGRDRAGM
jgi:AraC-like DNA-binding protein